MALPIEDKPGALRRLPSGVAGFLRRLGAAVLTPFVFSLRSGHLWSCLLGRPVNRSGQPIPWYSYPAVYFLSGRNFTGRRVLEFGAGHSTLWWAAQGAQVVALEVDSWWFERLHRALPSGVQLHLVSPDFQGVERLLPSEPFDLIVIDGPCRLRCARLAPPLLAVGGAVLLDDSEQYLADRPIAEFFRDRGFRRIDFIGHAPVVWRPRCTSLFFREDCFLLLGEEHAAARLAAF